MGREAWADVAAVPLDPDSTPQPLGPPPPHAVAAEAEAGLPWRGMVQSAEGVARHGKLTKLGGKRNDKWQEIDVHLSSTTGLSWTSGSALRDQVAGSQKVLTPQQLLSAAYYHAEIGIEFAFEVVSTAKGGKVYKFAASSDEDRDGWISAIERVARQDVSQTAFFCETADVDVVTANPVIQHADCHAASTDGLPVEVEDADNERVGATEPPSQRRSCAMSFCLRLSWCALMVLLGINYKNSCIGECGEHGSCRGFSCACTDNYIGLRCDESCGDHGVSEDSGCTCKDGFFGRSCAANCGEHGTTTQYHGQICSCDAGYPSGRCCPVGRDGATCEVILGPSGYAPSYVISGCVDETQCGKFVRTTSTCSGAPVYQLGATLDHIARDHELSSEGDARPGPPLLFLSAFPGNCDWDPRDNAESEAQMQWYTSSTLAPRGTSVAYLRSAPVLAAAAGPPTAPRFSNGCGWRDGSGSGSCLLADWERIEVIASEA